jgi:hypothetical protein
VAIEFRWANNQLDQLPALAADLVGLRPTVIVAAGALRSALEAKRATSTVPIVLAGAAFDPIKEGFVASLNRPGGNVTGLIVLGTELLGKRLELLSQMVPLARDLPSLLVLQTPFCSRRRRARYVKRRRRSVVKLLCSKVATTSSLRPSLTLLYNVGPVRFSLVSFHG